jgi:hypothetical protein
MSLGKLFESVTCSDVFIYQCLTCCKALSLNHAVSQQQKTCLFAMLLADCEKATHALTQQAANLTGDCTVFDGMYSTYATYTSLCKSAENDTLGQD